MSTAGVNGMELDAAASGSAKLGMKLIGATIGTKAVAGDTLQEDGPDVGVKLGTDDDPGGSAGDVVGERRE